jgi:hypothetical protein
MEFSWNQSIVLSHRVHEKCNNKFGAWLQQRKGRNFECLLFFVSQWRIAAKNGIMWEEIDVTGLFRMNIRFRLWRSRHMHGFMFDVVQGQRHTGEERLTTWMKRRKFRRYFLKAIMVIIWFISVNHKRMPTGTAPREIKEIKVLAIV